MYATDIIGIIKTGVNCRSTFVYINADSCPIIFLTTTVNIRKSTRSTGKKNINRTTIFPKLSKKKNMDFQIAFVAPFPSTIKMTAIAIQPYMANEIVFKNKPQMEPALSV